jgi:hypothetical protein
VGVVGRAGHNQHAVAVVLVAGAALGERAVQRVVDVGRTTVAQQVARRVVAEAHHLVGRIVVVSRADPVDRRAGAVAHQVVGVAVARRAALDGANQPAETVVVIGDRARGDQADGIEQDNVGSGCMAAINAHGAADGVAIVHPPAGPQFLRLPNWIIRVGN